MSGFSPVSGLTWFTVAPARIPPLPLAPATHRQPAD
jgi:hypothetical protein